MVNVCEKKTPARPLIPQPPPPPHPTTNTIFLGGCYKHTFYGITSYQCMEMTPALACANRCVFCWRHGTVRFGVVARCVLSWMLRFHFVKRHVPSRSSVRCVPAPRFTHRGVDSRRHGGHGLPPPLPQHTLTHTPYLPPHVMSPSTRTRWGGSGGGRWTTPWRSCRRAWSGTRP